MKKTLGLLCLVCFLPVNAYAQHAVFTDINVGAAILPDIKTVEYDFFYLGDHYVGNLSAGLETSLTAGGEIGIRNIGARSISASVSYDYLEANFESISATGTVNGFPAAVVYTKDDFEGYGLDLDSEVHTVLGNLRWDFVGPQEKVQPFIGIGGGVSFISGADTSPALGATAGLRFPLGHNFYAGIRYRYLRVFEVQNDIGLEYKDSDAHLFSFTIGAMTNPF